MVRLGIESPLATNLTEDQDYYNGLVLVTTLKAPTFYYIFSTRSTVIHVVETATHAQDTKMED